jgi:hypothetical protein
VHRERAGVGELEPAGVGADGQEQRRRDRLVELDVPLLEDLEDDLPGRGGFGDDQFLVGPVLLGEVVIDDELGLGVVGDALARGRGSCDQVPVSMTSKASYASSVKSAGKPRSTSMNGIALLLVDERVFRGRWLRSRTVASMPFFFMPSTIARWSRGRRRRGGRAW